MRGELTKKILEFVEDGINTIGDIIIVSMSAPYGSSMSRLEYETNKRRERRDEKQWKKEELKKRKIRLQKFIYKLKRDGVLEEKNDKLTLSDTGKIKVKLLKDKLPTTVYPKEKSDQLIIISFDIPETERKKRKWFRDIIKNLDFEMIHQSTWVGKTKVPKQLIIDLERIGILEYIEIIKVTSRGTLKKLKTE